jgi:hypothetical protein
VTQVELQEAEQRVKKILGSVVDADDLYIAGAPDPSKQQAKEAPLTLTPKHPRHVAVAINHLLAQRTKAIEVRDKAAKEVESLDAALLALGWGE